MFDTNSPEPDGLVAQLEQRIAELEFTLANIHLQTHILLDIAKALNASLDSKVIATNIIRAITGLMPIAKASVFLYDEETDCLKTISLFDSESSSPALPEGLDLSCPHLALAKGTAYYRPNHRHDYEPVDGWGWVCCLPLQTTQLKIGTINLHAIDQVAITPEQVEFLETVAEHASTALENAALYALVAHESITDGLTGVYNHSYFQKRLREALAYQRRTPHPGLGLLIIDVDFFKSFNDHYGHQFGDTVLKAVVRSIKHHIRTEDFLARYGGEEFVLLISDATEEALVAISEKIREIVELEKVIHPETGNSVSITVSVGATLWHPSDTPTALIARADNALYRAKQLGRNQSIFEL